MSEVSIRRDSQVLFSLAPSSHPRPTLDTSGRRGGGEEGRKEGRGRREGRGRKGSFHLRYRIQVLRNPTPHLFGVAMLYCAFTIPRHVPSHTPPRFSPLFSISISYPRLKVQRRIHEERKRINNSEARWFCRSIQRSPHLTPPPPPSPSLPLPVRLWSRQLSFSAIFRDHRSIDAW